MSMIFPGMDPYLENSLTWHGFHNRWVVHLADHLQSLLSSRYITSVEERVFVEGPESRDIEPDVWVREEGEGRGGPGVAIAEGDAPVLLRIPELEVHETFIEILDRQFGQAIVTMIELLSPTNKVPGPGRHSYLTKQREVRASKTHLVEIDLLRAGPRVLAVPEWALRRFRPYDYVVCVNRAHERRDVFELYFSAVRKKLPKIHVPLAEGDPDVVVDLLPVLSYTYEVGSYRRRLRYDAPCQPPLSPEDQAWANDLLREAGVLTAATP